MLVFGFVFTSTAKPKAKKQDIKEFEFYNKLPVRLDDKAEEVTKRFDSLGFKTRFEKVGKNNVTIIDSLTIDNEWFEQIRFTYKKGKVNVIMLLTGSSGTVYRTIDKYKSEIKNTMSALDIGLEDDGITHFFFDNKKRIMFDGLEGTITIHFSN